MSEESVTRYHDYKSSESCFKYKLEKCGPEYREMSMAALHYLRKGCHVTSSLCREGILFQFLVRLNCSMCWGKSWTKKAQFDNVVVT